MRYAGEKRFNVWTALTLILLALFLLFVIYPIGMLIVKSLFVGGKVDLSYFVKFFSKKYYWVTLVNSFKVTVLSTLLACLIGVPMAYLLRSVKIRGSEFLNILIVISYLSPPFIGAYAWIQLLGRNGFITRILNALFHVKLHGIYGFAGIVLVFSLQSFPLIYMYVSGAMKNLDNSLNEAAESLGCNAFQRVTKVIFPLVLPSLLAGMLLVFMRVFSDFGTPMIIGEGYKTFPVMLYTQFMGEVGTNDGFAATMCVIVIVIALMFFFIQKLLGQKFTYSMTALKPMQAQEAEGWRKVCAHLAVYLVTLVAALPQITVIITSFIGTINGSLFTGEFTLKKNIKESTKENPVYTVLCGGEPAAFARLAQTGADELYGFEIYGVERVYGVQLVQNESVRLSLPTGCTAKINGVELSSWSEHETAEIPEAAEFGEYLTSAPQMDSYAVTGLMYPPEVEFSDGSGKPLETLRDENGAYSCGLPLTDSAAAEQAKEFALEFSELYSKYIANDVYFSSISGYIPQDTELYSNLSTYEGQFYTYHSGYDFTEEQVRRVT